jgi:hypothetical protein
MAIRYELGDFSGGQGEHIEEKHVKEEHARGEDPEEDGTQEKIEAKS